jgi:hypothetical protein
LKKQQKVYQNLQNSGFFSTFAEKLTNDEEKDLTNECPNGDGTINRSPACQQDREAESD